LPSPRWSSERSIYRRGRAKLIPCRRCMGQLGVFARAGCGSLAAHFKPQATPLLRSNAKRPASSPSISPFSERNSEVPSRKSLLACAFGNPTIFETNMELEGPIRVLPAGSLKVNFRGRAGNQMMWGETCPRVLFRFQR